MQPALLATSKDPREHFKQAADRGRERWFLRHGDRAFAEFLRRLQSSPDTRKLKYRVSTSRLDSQFLAKGTIEIEFRDGTRFNRQTYGSASDRRQAGIISKAECLERLAVASSRLRGPNGTSFHSSAAQTLKRAFCELIERDSFLANWYSDQPIPQSLIDRKHALSGPAATLSERGWRLREHRWNDQATGAVTVWISIMRETPRHDQWNLFFGGGASTDYAGAQVKALAEARFCFDLFTAKNVGVPDTRKRFSPASLAEMVNRIAYLQRPGYAELFADRLAAPKRVPGVSGRTPGHADAVRFVTRCLKRYRSARVTPLLVPANLVDHVFCANVSCEELQSLDFEVSPRLNAKRIKQLYGTPARRLGKVLHPIL